MCPKICDETKTTWLIPESRLTLTIPFLSLTWVSHIHPLSPRYISWLYWWVTRGMHSLPSLTTICPFTCKHFLLHYFLFVFMCLMVTTPSPFVAPSSHFPCSSSFLHISLADPLPHGSITRALIPVVRNLARA